MFWPFSSRSKTERHDRDQSVDARLEALGRSISQAGKAVDANAPRVAVVTTRARRAAARRDEEIRLNHLDRLFIGDMRSQVSRGDRS